MHLERFGACALGVDLSPSQRLANRPSNEPATLRDANCRRCAIGIIRRSIAWRRRDTTRPASCVCAVHRRRADEPTATGLGIRATTARVLSVFSSDHTPGRPQSRPQNNTLFVLSTAVMDPTPVFFNHEDRGTGPALARRLESLLAT